MKSSLCNRSVRLLSFFNSRSEIAEDWLSSIILHKRLSIKMNSYLLLTLLLLFLVTFIIPLILRITLNSPTTVAIINKPVVNEFKNIST